MCIIVIIIVVVVVVVKRKTGRQAECELDASSQMADLSAIAAHLSPLLFTIHSVVLRLIPMAKRMRLPRLFIVPIIITIYIERERGTRREK